MSADEGRFMYNVPGLGIHLSAIGGLTVAYWDRRMHKSAIKSLDMTDSQMERYQERLRGIEARYDVVMARMEASK